MTPATNKLRDALGAGESYLHAIKLALEGAKFPNGRDYCAISLLVEGAANEMQAAQAVVDEMEAD